MEIFFFSFIIFHLTMVSSKHINNVKAVSAHRIVQPNSLRNWGPQKECICLCVDTWSPLGYVLTLRRCSLFRMFLKLSYSYYALCFCFFFEIQWDLFSESSSCSYAWKQHVGAGLFGKRANRTVLSLMVSSLFLSLFKSLTHYTLKGSCTL